MVIDPQTSVESILVGARYAFPLEIAYGPRRKGIPRTHGVYVIRCVDGRFYVGSTSGKDGFRARLTRYICYLQKGVHVNQALQGAFNDLGVGAFTCFILEEINATEALKREQHYLDTLQPFDGTGFNKARIAGASMQGFKHSEKALERMRQAQSSRTRSKEELQATRERSRELWNDPAFRQKIKASRLRKFQLMYDGVLHSGEHLTEFAAKHNILRAYLSEVLNGRKKHHKGWYKPETPSPWHGLVAPDGTSYRFYSTTDFAKKHGLQQSHLNKVLLGKSSQHLGWVKA